MSEERVWVPDTAWRVVAPSDRRCRWTVGPAHRSCGRPAVADFQRGYRKTNRWAYCKDHLYGRRFENGQVLVSVHPESPAAQRGWA